MSLVIVETDSLLVKQQLGSLSVSNSSPLGRLYDDTVADIGLVHCLHLCHTKRQANLAAHTLARNSFLSNQVISRSTNPPGFLAEVLVSEQLAP